MQDESEPLAPKTSAEDWEALDRIARQLMNGAPRNETAAPLPEPARGRSSDLDGPPDDASPLLALIDLLPLAIAICGNGRVAHANAAFAYALGFRSGAEIVSAGGLDTLFPDALSLETLRSAVAPAPAQVRTKSGRRTQIPVLVRACPGEDADLIMLCGAPTPAPSAPPHLPAANLAPPAIAPPMRNLAQDQFDFLAKVSHEVRTPLNSIIGFAGLMLGERFGPVGSPRYRNYLENIQDSGHYALRLVNDLLDISKIQAGAFQIDFTSVNLRETIADAIATVQPFAHRARVVLRVSVADGVPYVVADAFRLKQVLLNLLSNAIKFSPERGQIVVSAGRTADGAVRIKVRDSGAGMSPAEIEIAMQPFRQLDTTARIETGTGLGLPLTKTLAEAMRARFQIDSIPGEGTTVEIVFGPDRVVSFQF